MSITIPKKQYNELAKWSIKTSKDIFSSTNRDKSKETELTKALLDEVELIGTALFVGQLMKNFKPETRMQRIKRALRTISSTK